MSRLPQHGGELPNRPVDLLRGDHQRRREPQRRILGVLDQHAALGQPQADCFAGLAGAKRRIDVDAGPQAEAAHRHHAVADQPT